MRILLLGGLLGLSVLLPQNPAAPPVPGALRGAEAARAGELDRQCGTEQEAGDWAAAAKTAAEIQDLRERVQGKSHWQAIDARWMARLLERMAALPEAERDKLHEARATYHQSLAKLKAGDAAGAEPLARAALQAHEAAFGEQHPLVALMALNLSTVLKKQLRYSEAEVHGRRAHNLRLKLLGDQHPRTADSASLLSDVLRLQGQFDEAAALEDFAYKLNGRVMGAEHPATLTSGSNLGSCLRDLGILAEAETLQRLILAQRRRLLGDRHTDTLTTINNLALTLDAQAQHGEAEPLHREALAAREAHDRQGLETARSLNNLGLCLDQQQRPLEGEQLHRRALAIYRSVTGKDSLDTARSLNNLAANLADQGKLQEAQELYLEALQIQLKLLGKRHLDTLTTAVNWAMCLADQDQLAMAAPILEQAASFLLEDLGPHHPMTLMAFQYWAQVCLRQGKLDQAEKLFLTVASLSPASARRAAATGLRRAEAVHLDPLPLLAAIWARQGRPVEAFERLEQSYGRGTWEEATRQLSPADKQRLQTLAGNCRRREQQLTQLAMQRAVPLQVRAELLKQHTEAAHALAEFNLSLARKNPASVGGPPPYSLERIQAALPADAALVAYVSAPRLRWACVVRKHGSPKWLNLAAQAEGGDWSKDDIAPLFEMAAELRQHRRDDWEELCVQLKRQWLQPLEPLLTARDGLPATRTLLLLPSPALRGMPLAVFSDQYQVAAVPSASIFAWLRGKPAPASPPRLLLLADPLYAHDRLPATRWEADALARQVEAKLGPGTVKTLLGPEATAARLTPEVAAPNRNASYRWLHFAMHGEEDTRRSLGTRLRFPTLPPDQPGGPSRRSAISAAEVFESWNLDAALVTMSACETGLGKRALGEGCLGFSQALLLTGARSVLLSQWSVHDGATALLMSRFYENLLGGRPAVSSMSKGAALHEAQSWLRTLTAAEARKLTAGLNIAMLKNAASDSRPFAHPYYWAGFVLTGDPD